LNRYRTNSSSKKKTADVSQGSMEKDFNKMLRKIETVANTRGYKSAREEELIKLLKQ
jgi:hypothetical protein